MSAADRHADAMVDRGTTPVKIHPALGAPPAPASALTGKAVRVSPTSVDTFKDCPRKWWYRWVAGVQTPQHPSARTGSAVHTVLEKHLEGVEWDKTGATAHRSILFPAIEAGHFPAPGTVAVERRVQMAVGQRRLALPFVGKIDFSPRTEWDGIELDVPMSSRYHLSKNPHWIGDLKTSGDPERWMPSRERLGRDPQVLVYAFAAYADLPGGPPAEVALTHVWVAAKGRPRAHRIDATAPWARAAAAWDELATASRRMVPLLAVADADDVEANPGACGKYGGCPHAKSGLCAVGEAVRAGRIGTSLIGMPSTRGGTNVEITPPARPASENPMNPFAAKLLGGKPPPPPPPPATTATTPAKAKPAAQKPAPAAAATTTATAKPAPAASTTTATTPAGAAGRLRKPAPANGGGPAETPGAVNPPNALPSPTATRAQVLECAELVKVADVARIEAGATLADDAYVLRLLGRSGLPDDCLATVLEAARGNGDGTPPGGKGPAGATEPPPPPVEEKGPGADDLRAAEAVRDAIGLAGAGILTYAGVRIVICKSLNQKRPRKTRIESILQLGKAREWFIFDSKLDVYVFIAEATTADAPAPGGGEASGSEAAGDANCETPPGAPSPSAAGAELPPEPGEAGAPAEGVTQWADWPILGKCLVRVGGEDGHVCAAVVRESPSGDGYRVCIEGHGGGRYAAPDATADGGMVTKPAPDPAGNGGMVDLATFVALDASGETEVHINAAPAPAADLAPANAPALDALAIVFVGCLPVGVAVDLDLAALVAPLERIVAAEDLKGDDGRAPSHYLLPAYRRGQRALAARLDGVLRAAVQSAGRPPFRTLFVDPGHPAGDECLAVLTACPGVLVVRGVR